MPPDSPRPTPAELEILSALYALGPATVRQVHAHLDPDTGYTTTLKQMQVMADKGLLTRDESSRAHTYRPAVPEHRVHATLIANLLDRAFGGSAKKLVAAALSARRTPPAELDEIRKLVESARAQQTTSQRKGDRP